MLSEIGRRTDYHSDASPEFEMITLNNNRANQTPDVLFNTTHAHNRAISQGNAEQLSIDTGNIGGAGRNAFSSTERPQER